MDEPWRINELQDLIDEEPLQGPFVHLIPEVQFQFSEPKAPATNTARSRPVRKVVSKANRVVLAFEVRPFIDDGKHWVLYTDGNCERVEIDSRLVQDQQVQIRPIVGKDRPSTQAEQPNLEYLLVMVTSGPVKKSLQLTAYNHIVDKDLTVAWDATAPDNEAYESVGKTITTARRFAWQPYQMGARGGVLQVWDHADQTADPPANPRRNLSMFSVLGGRAAIEETLQLQNLSVTENSEQKTIDIDSLQGVKVTSHPFEEMLGGEPGGSLELARVVPSDRLFLYVGKPESITAMLDSGAPYIASLGTTLTGNCLHYNLEGRYLAKLGMTRDWVDAVLKSGLTSEMALFTPDLFFIDGTDLTVVAKLRQPKLLQQLLTLLGAAKLTSTEVLELPTTSGGPCLSGVKR